MRHVVGKTGSPSCASLPSAGMTRIRFDGSPRCLAAERTLSPLTELPWNRRASCGRGPVAVNRSEGPLSNVKVAIPETV